MDSITDHARWFADIRRLLDITEVTPGLPLPRIAPERATFFYVGITHAADARESVRTAEMILGYALGVAFIARRTTPAGSSAHYILTAVLPSGLQVDLVGLAEHFDGQDEDASQFAGLAA